MGFGSCKKFSAPRKTHRLDKNYRSEFLSLSPLSLIYQVKVTQPCPNLKLCNSLPSIFAEENLLKHWWRQCILIHKFAATICKNLKLKRNNGFTLQHVPYFSSPRIDHAAEILPIQTNMLVLAQSRKLHYCLPSKLNKWTKSNTVWLSSVQDEAEVCLWQLQVTNQVFKGIIMYHINMGKIWWQQVFEVQVQNISI